MEKDITGLLENLQKQLEIYRKLLSLALEKQPVLVKANIPELERITKAEELLIVQVGKLEGQRQALHQALANHFAFSPEELLLSELLTRVGDGLKPQMQQVYAELSGVLKELTGINESNTQLIKGSLEYVNLTISLLTNLNTAPLYSETDEQKGRAVAKVFDRKI